MKLRKIGLMVAAALAVATVGTVTAATPALAAGGTGRLPDYRELRRYPRLRVRVVGGPIL